MFVPAGDLLSHSSESQRAVSAQAGGHHFGRVLIGSDVQSSRDTSRSSSPVAPWARCLLSFSAS
jgi:hypothetical protein